ncbi:MAG: rod shape-determining protein MreD [Actinomycetota bacterium]
MSPGGPLTAAIAKSTALFFFAVVVQVTIVASIGILGGSPDLVLVILVAVALANGSIFGAISGFWAGLVLDVAQIGTLGFTSLLLTLAGFWIGRYGETTGRDRAHAPLLSVAVVTVLYSVGSLILHYLLREPASASVALVHVLPGSVLLNLLLAFPVFALVRRLFHPPERRPEVEFVG